MNKCSFIDLLIRIIGTMIAFSINFFFVFGVICAIAILFFLFLR